MLAFIATTIVLPVINIAPAAGLNNIPCLNNIPAAKGNATKLDVLLYVREQEPCIDLLNILDLELNKKGDVPCPAQDIADAICIVKSQWVASPILLQ